jgi:hypothetical protein
VPESFESLIPYVARAFDLDEPRIIDSFRPASDSDLPQILALRRAVTPKMWWDDEAFLKWRYLQRRMNDGSVPYWIFVKDGQVMGGCGLESVTLVVDGQPVPATRTMDIMVHPDVDGRGLGAFMNLMLFRRFPIAIVTGCNATSKNLISRMFHHTTDLVFWKTVMASQPLVQRVYNGPFSKNIADSVDLMLAAARWTRNVDLPSGIHIRECTRFDERVTDLSRRCERLGRVIVRRDADYLNWRFFDNPRCRYRAYVAFRGDRIDGYVVTQLNLARHNPHREGDIVDWLAVEDVDGTESPLAALIEHGLKALIKDGAGIVSCAAHGAGLGVAAATNGFRRRDAQRIPFFVRAGVPRVQSRLSSEAGWYLTRADLDVE